MSDNLKVPTTVKILSKMIDTIENQGWVQNAYKLKQGVCLVGSTLVPEVIQEFGSVAIGEALSYLHDHLKKKNLAEAYSCIESWNDQKHRTKEEVVAALKSAIEGYFLLSQEVKDSYRGKVYSNHGINAMMTIVNVPDVIKIELSLEIA